MEKFLSNLGVSEGIIQTIKWWSPLLGGIALIVAIIIVVMIIKHRKNKYFYQLIYHKLNPLLRR
ncbi:MAG: hypothetical protein ACREV6_24510 [Clostridium sp.]|uniref:hypothetical protein n=1 Tax=Clostridium sp. TaxID=1506 RepID=UPI003D6D0727